MILNKKEILKLIKKKKLIIEPFELENIRSASILLTLDNRFRTFNKARVDTKTDYKNITKLFTNDKIILEPDELILGITKERIKFPENVMGLLQGRTRFARLGLLIHITANIIQPGTNNKQVLEMKNASNNAITIYAGDKICQLILMEVKGKAPYDGDWQDQVSL